MSNAVSAQHPAVVLRSTYQHLRALLAIAAIAVVGLTVAVVVLAISGSSTTTSPAVRVTSSAVRATPATSVGPNPDQRGVQPLLPQPAPTINYPGHYYATHTTRLAETSVVPAIVRCSGGAPAKARLLTPARARADQLCR